jgi:hypothetical protein
MAAARRLPKHLRNVLGADAGDEMLTILDDIRADSAAMREGFDRLEASISALRLDMDRRFDTQDRRLDERFDRIDARFAAMEGKIADVKSDLMKWSFVFWCGAVFAVAALAGVLRQ